MQKLQKAGSHLIRSTILMSAVLTMSSLPSVAAPTFSQPADTTANQDDVVYGVAPHQLIVIQKPMTAATTMAPLSIGTIGANALPSSLSIDYSSKPLSVGGTPSARSFPQFRFVPQGADLGGLDQTPVRSPFETHVIQTNPGFLDQTTRTEIRFSF